MTLIILFLVIIHYTYLQLDQKERKNSVHELVLHIYWLNTADIIHFSGDIHNFILSN